MRKPSESYLKLKKATDKILSGAGLVILSPVFAGIAIAIKLEDGITAPVFFKQKRVGIHKVILCFTNFEVCRLIHHMIRQLICCQIRSSI